MNSNPTLHKRVNLKNIDYLACYFGFESKYLLRIAGDGRSYLREVEYMRVAKGDKIKCTYDAEPELKKIQKVIKDKLLSKVEWPDYIQGAVKGRSAVTSVSFHKQQKTIINLDVSHFFPSVKGGWVQKVWQCFFHFPPEVAKLLTELTTFVEPHKDTSSSATLVQGLCTSPALANLIFFEKESSLVDNLLQLGWKYSRYIDDIIVSHGKKISPKGCSKPIDMVLGMMKYYGLRINKKKTRARSGARQNVHRVHPDRGLHPEKLSDIVKEIEDFLDNYPDASTTQERLIGLLQYASNWHPNFAKKWNKKLERITTSSEFRRCSVISPSRPLFFPTSPSLTHPHKP